MNIHWTGLTLCPRCSEVAQRPIRTCYVDEDGAWHCALCARIFYDEVTHEADQADGELGPQEVGR